MTINFVLRALHYIMPVIAALIALISILKKGNDDGSKVKRTLRWSILLVLAALVGTWAIQFLDDIRQERSAEVQLKQNNELIEQVIRGEYPLQNIRASYKFGVLATLKGISEYQERLAQSMSGIVSQMSSEKYRRDNDIVAGSPGGRDVVFCNKSPLMPSSINDPEAAMIMGRLRVNVLLYRQPVQPEHWQLFSNLGAPVPPDLELVFVGEQRCIEYDASQQIMTVG